MQKKASLPSRVLLVLSLSFLFFGSLASYLAPCGNWMNQIYDRGVWYEHDPGGFYVADAHDLAPLRRGPRFEGHPGTPLLISLAAIQHVYFRVASFGSSLGFSAFTVRHLTEVFFLSKTFICLIQILGLFLFSRFAKRLLNNARAETFALLLYASSFPVLYYLSRISVEPLMLVFFFATFLSVWASQKSLSLKKTWGYAALAGVFSVSAFVCKVHLMALLPLVAAGVLLQDSGPNRRLTSLISFGIGAVVIFGFYSLFIDWGYFFSKWSNTGGSSALSKHGNSLFSSLLSAFSAIPLRNFFPSTSPSGIFLYLELPLVVLGIWGGVSFWKDHVSERPKLWGLFAMVGVSLLSWFYRSLLVGGFQSFHYLFLAVVLLALFAGHLLDKAIRPSFNLAPAVVGVLLIHSAAVWSVVGSRLIDISRFRSQHAIYFNAIEQTRETERIGILNAPTPFDPVFLVGLGGIGEKGRLTEELRKIFVPITDSGTGELSLKIDAANSRHVH